MSLISYWYQTMSLNRSKEIPLKAQLGAVGSRSMALTGAWKPKAAARPKLESHKNKSHHCVMMVMYLSLLQSHYKWWTCMQYIEIPSFVQKNIMNHESWTSRALVFTTFSPYLLWGVFSSQGDCTTAGAFESWLAGIRKGPWGTKVRKPSSQLPWAYRWTPMSTIEIWIGAVEMKGSSGYTL